MRGGGGGGGGGRRVGGKGREGGRGGRGRENTYGQTFTNKYMQTHINVVWHRLEENGGGRDFLCQSHEPMSKTA